MALGYIVHNKVLLVILIAAIIGGVAYFNINKQETATAAQPVKIPYYQQIEPTKAEAPKAVQTQTRVYYASKIFEGSGKVILMGWYDFDAKKWVRHDEPLPLDKKIVVKIYDR